MDTEGLYEFGHEDAEEVVFSSKEEDDVLSVEDSDDIDIVIEEVVVDNCTSYVQASNEDDDTFDVEFFDFTEIINENNFAAPAGKSPKKDTRRSTIVQIPTHICVRDQPVYWRVREREFQDRKTSRNYKQFQNCMIFRFKIVDGNACTIKIFKNGTLHVTGCRSEEEVVGICTDFINAIADFLKEDGHPVKVPVLGEVKFCMTKAGFKFNTADFPRDGKSLDLHMLTWLLLKSRKFFNVEYNSDVYFGIKTTCMNPAYKTNIFKSGAVNLYTTSPDEVPKAFESLITILKNGRNRKGEESSCD